MGNLHSSLTQVFPPKPKFTEADLPDLHDKVYIVTGSSAGVGKELARMLYAHNAKVYIAARSPEKAQAAIDEIRTRVPSPAGELVFLKLDLADLTTIKATVNEFLSKERRLDVLFNNAGVMTPPGTKGIQRTAQGLEMNMGVNCVGTFMLTKLLTPILASTAKIEDPGAVRVVWVASSGAEANPTPGGIDMDNIDFDKSVPVALIRYAISKTGNYLHAVEYAKRTKEDGIVSIAVNPGNLDSELYRDQKGWFMGPFIWFLRHTVFYPPLNGAYTELFAGLAPEVADKTGSWIVPWGRVFPIKKSLVKSTKTKDEGGNGVGLRFWNWTEEQVTPHL